jgi:hypothetical protein
MIEEAMKGSHLKGHFKRFRFDFYKPDGFSPLEPVLLKDEKRNKKLGITYMALCIGDSIDLNIQLKENGVEHT